MATSNYSASMVKLPFWFAEFRKMISLLNEGLSYDEIKTTNLEENVFSAPSSDRAAQLFNTVSRRIQTLDKRFLSLFEQVDVSNQKLIALMAVMQDDLLFFEFMYEVFREKLIIGLLELSDSDFSVFFRNKQARSDRVASWTVETLIHLAGSYKAVLANAGVLDGKRNSRQILRPLLDPVLESQLAELGMGQILRVLTGTN